MKDNLRLAVERYIQVREELEEAILALHNVAARAFAELPHGFSVRWCFSVAENIELLVTGSQDSVSLLMYLRCIVPNDKHHMPELLFGNAPALPPAMWLPYLECVEAMTTDEVATLLEEMPCAVEFEAALIARMT
jgi:hypothetical protein